MALLVLLVNLKDSSRLEITEARQSIPWVDTLPHVSQSANHVTGLIPDTKTGCPIVSFLPPESGRK